MIEIPGFPAIQPGACRIVAEAGPCNGDLAYAIAAADAIKAAGAWAMKIQVYEADRLVTRDAPRYDLTDWKGQETQHEVFQTALAWSDIVALKGHCDQIGLLLFASCFDLAAVDFCHQLGMPLFKVASGDITHKPLIEAVARTGKPIILSTGASELAEIERAFSWVAAVNPDAKVLPLMCTLAYPTPPDQAHLARLTTWRRNVGEMVGYSDHTEGMAPMVRAATLGAVLIEKHFTLTPGEGGDHDFAIDAGGISGFQDALDLLDAETVPTSPWDGSPDIKVHAIERPARIYARRSVAAKVDIPYKTIITPEMVTWLRPALGIPPFESVAGLKAAQDIKAGELITRGMVGKMTARLTVE